MAYLQIVIKMKLSSRQPAELLGDQDESELAWLLIVVAFAPIRMLKSIDSVSETFINFQRLQDRKQGMRLQGTI